MEGLIRWIVGVIVGGAVAGVVTGIIVIILKRPWKQVRVVIGIVFAVVAILSIIVLLQWQPYKVANAQWYLENDGSLQVTGRLTSLIWGEPKAGYAVQIKIFQAGENSPFKGPEFATTDADGEFTVKFAPPDPVSGEAYLINTAYSYHNFFLGERWVIRDFMVGEPSTIK